MTIPFSQIVNAIPGVVSAGGTALSLSGLFLTNATVSGTIPRVPVGTVLSLTSPAAVSAYFGANSTEYGEAQTYFAGYTNCLAYPGAMLFATYPGSAVSAFLRGGSLASLGLAGVQAISTGALSVTIDGVVKTAASVNLSTATSFSDAASKLTTALGLSGSAVAYDSISGAFVISSGTTGSTSTMTYATSSSGNVATTLLLTSATGAVLSQGAAATTPSAFMTALIAINSNWAAFTHVFDPDSTGNTNKLAFAAWNATQGNRYLYVPWDVDQSPVTTNPATSSLGYLVGASGNNYSGTAPISQTAVTYHGAAFVLGYAASLNFNSTNGRATAMFRTQSGLAASISSSTAYSNLIANGYSCVGAFGNANATDIILANGQVSGQFLWIDSYLNQIWLNYSLQSAIFTAFTNFPSFPYNPDGYSLIEASCAPVLQQFVKYGGAHANVTLSAAEIAAVNSAAGKTIAPALSQQGWWLGISDPGATARANRQTPICILFYVDGQSVQSLTINSFLVQ